MYDDTDGIRPTRGQRATFSQDFAGLGGDVRYLRTRADATKYKTFGGGWILSVHGEGGYHQGAAEIAGAGPRRHPAHRPLLRPRAFAASTSAASAPVSNASPTTREGDLTIPPATIIASTTRSAARPIIWAGSSSRFRSSCDFAERGPAAVCVHRRGLALDADAARASPISSSSAARRDSRPDSSTHGRRTRAARNSTAARVTGYADDVDALSAWIQGSLFSAIRRSPAFRSASASTGFRRSVRCGSISPRRY